MGSLGGQRQQHGHKKGRELMVALTTLPLGKTGMEITRVGFGAWALGGAGWAGSWGPQDDEESMAAIRHAVEAGVNWVDTAAVYGLGHSEEVVAAALDGIPKADRPFVFTKCGLAWDEQDRYRDARKSGRPESIRAELEASLRRLRRETIDLYQMHWPPTDGTTLDEYWATLLQLKDEGKIRAVGLSNHSVAQLQAAEALGHVDTLQPPFSAIKRAAAPEVAWCAAHSAGVIVYSPMQAGLLTGAFSAERVARLHGDDWRTTLSSRANAWPATWPWPRHCDRWPSGGVPRRRPSPWPGCCRGRGLPGPSWAVATSAKSTGGCRPPSWN